MRGSRTIATLAAGAGLLLAGCSTDGVSDVGPTGATLNGTIQGGDSGGSYVFQYAKTRDALGTPDGWTTPRREVTAGTPSTPVTEAVTGLEPSTTYAYRLCGQVPCGWIDTCLGTRRFTTPPAGSRSITFDTPGVHRFTVPAGVTKVEALAVGGGGGGGENGHADWNPWPRYYYTPTGGGKGGSVQTPIYALSPGEVLEVRVGGRGQDYIDPEWIFAGAGGAGGTNGVDHGGDGGSGGNPWTLADPQHRPGGRGGGGGGAPSSVWAPDEEGGTRVEVVGGGGGGGGGHDADFQPAAGGAGGSGQSGRDGAREDSRRPVSLGGEAGTWPGNGQGGLGGGEDADGASGGDGGSAGKPNDYSGCKLDLYAGGGGGGGGWRGGGGGGLGASLFDGCPADGSSYTVSDDEASGGGAGASYSRTNPEFGPQPVYNAGVESGDGFVTLFWTAP